MTYQTGLFEKTLQDFRNELQEISFKETHNMQFTGETRASNLVNRLLDKLDEDYGTRYERTKSVKNEVEEV